MEEGDFDYSLPANLAALYRVPWADSDAGRILHYITKYADLDGLLPDPEELTVTGTCS